MSGSLATLYDPETGLARNRNDPRYLMAQKLLEDKQPTAINSAGATWASALGGVARAYAAQKLMGDAKADGQAAGERQEAKANESLAAIGMGPNAMPLPDAAPAAAPAPAPVAPAPSSDDSTAVANAIWGQESGGRPTSATSVNGARGGWQIIPSTFAQYAQPGEDISNPEHNEKVGRRIVADLYEKSGRDPARTAVGYFSGPGNIAPAGSATPWLEDRADGNKFRTSAYVQGVLGRLGTGSAASSAAPDEAKPFLVGDSIAKGFADKNQTDGGGTVSANPQAILDKINAMPADSLRGRTVYLSSGVSNAPDQMPVVQQHIEALKARGASNVVLLGVGNRADLAGLNGPLAELAQKNGAQFRPIQAGKDGVHPDDYGGLIAAKQQQPAPSGPQLSGPAMAAKLDPSIGGAAKPGAAPTQRRTPEELQAAAITFAASGNPYLQRAAAGLQAQAQQAIALRDRQAAAGERAAEQRRRDQERREDRDFAQRQAEDARRERQQMSIEGRVPPGYQWNADRTQLVAIPGGPVPTRQEATAQAERERQARLNQTLDERVPPGYRWNADHTAQEKVPGGPADKPEKPPSDGVTKGIMGNMSSLRQLDDAIAAVGKNGQAFGWDQAVPLVSRFGPQSSIDARAQVSNIGSLKLHERSGAAVTAAEYPRLAPFIPSASDPPETVKTKLEGMRRIMQDQLRDQYDTYGPGNGYKPVPGHAAALGLDDAGNPVPAPAAPALPGGAAVRPTSAAGGPAPASAQPQAKARGVQAIEAARAKLGANASDDDVVNEARKMLYGG